MLERKMKNLIRIVFSGAQKMLKLTKWCINLIAMITPLPNETKRVTDVFFEVMRGKEEREGEIS